VPGVPRIRRPVLIAAGVVVVLVATVVLLRGTDPESALTSPDRSVPTTLPAIPVLPFEDPVPDALEDASVDSDPASSLAPPGEAADSAVIDAERWPGITQLGLETVDHWVERSFGRARVLVVVDCDAEGITGSIGVAVVGASPNTDVVALVNPEIDMVVGVTTDPSGAGFRLAPGFVDASEYTLTFPELGSVSVVVPGCGIES
jgi:hypothetical protein